MADQRKDRVNLTPDELREIMRRLALGLRPAMLDIVDDPIPGPLLQALSNLARVEKERGGEGDDAG